MKNEILVAGGTGDLGGRIIKALVEKGAAVRAVVRKETSPEKVAELERQGVMVIRIDMSDQLSLAAACTGINCVVSALAGLREVIVDTQSILLDAAVAAGVSRFIPSDYSTDFTQLKDGDNRNFDLRREFMRRIDETDIAATSIFNGAFAELLNYNIPFLDHKKQTVSYWGDPDWKVDFTTMDNTAAYTAAAALDNATPRFLRIASFQPSAREMAAVSGYALTPMGSLEALSAYNKHERAAHPEGEQELYAKWQQNQYMHSMFSAHNETLDNARYTVEWTGLNELLAKRWS